MVRVRTASLPQNVVIDMSTHQAHQSFLGEHAQDDMVQENLAGLAQARSHKEVVLLSRGTVPWCIFERCNPDDGHPWGTPLQDRCSRVPWSHGRGAIGRSSVAPSSPSLRAGGVQPARHPGRAGVGARGSPDHPRGRAARARASTKPRAGPQDARGRRSAPGMGQGPGMGRAAPPPRWAEQQRAAARRWARQQRAFPLGVPRRATIPGAGVPWQPRRGLRACSEGSAAVGIQPGRPAGVQPGGALGFCSARGEERGDGGHRACSEGSAAEPAGVQPGRACRRPAKPAGAAKPAGRGARRAPGQRQPREVVAYVASRRRAAWRAADPGHAGQPLGRGRALAPSRRWPRSRRSARQLAGDACRIGTRAGGVRCDAPPGARGVGG